MSCIGMQAVLDSYVCLFHLVIGIFIGVFLLCFSLIRVIILTNRHSSAILHFFILQMILGMYFYWWHFYISCHSLFLKWDTLWLFGRPVDPVNQIKTGKIWDGKLVPCTLKFVHNSTFFLPSQYFSHFFPPQTSLLLLDFQSFTFWLTIYFTFCCLCIPTGFLKYIATPQEILAIPSTGNIYSEFLWFDCLYLSVSFLSLLIHNHLLTFLIKKDFLHCPNNYLHIEPKPNFVIAIVAWTFIQIIVLILQDRLGPRFFVPKFVSLFYFWIFLRFSSLLVFLDVARAIQLLSENKLLRRKGMCDLYESSSCRWVRNHDHTL